MGVYVVGSTAAKMIKTAITIGRALFIGTSFTSGPFELPEEML